MTDVTPVAPAADPVATIATAPTGATPPVTTAAPAPATDWTSSIADESVRSWVTAKGFKDPAALAQSALNLEKLTGAPADRIIKLPTDANAAEWDQVYNKLGRPETADKYDIPVPEGDNGEFAKTAKEWFHKAGLSASQARTLAEMNNNYIAELNKAHTEKTQQAHEAEMGRLKTEWGGEYQSRVELVDRAAESFGMSKDQLLALKQTMGPAAAMKFLHNIGAKVAVPANGLVSGEGGGSFGGATPEQAQARISQLRQDKAFISQFNSKDDKTRFDARAEMDRLHRIAYPQG
ncbi:hypothetical protein [Nitrosovibrio sp. Nv4]|uniref:hypothetical protein n=1 Tax=Nitrosovibrio sp. Nv4 TaxID=1945880 RepID=UPI000BD5A752|nr:hypothetical protein [Nitrosovibrio sp. Nv4]SOD41327.1 hypothetical protein SAMN06298226_1622 [Nitrosovibrio sp. Nv4]